MFSLPHYLRKRAATLWLVAAYGILGPLVSGSSLDNIHLEDLLSEEKAEWPWIRQVMQDSEGFVWLLTHNTVLKYDGNVITRFPDKQQSPTGLPVAKVNRIASDASGDVWILQPGSLSKYDRKTGGFKTFGRTDEDGVSVISGAYTLLGLPNGNLAAGGQRGLVIFDITTSEWTRIHRRIGQGMPAIRDIALLDDNTLLVASTDGLWQYDLPTGEFTRFRFAPEKSPVASNLDLRRVMTDQQQRLWLSEQDGSLLVYSFDGEQIELSIEGTSIDDYYFSSYIDLHEDREGNIWAAPSEGGLVALAPNSTNFTSFESVGDGFDSPLDFAIVDIAELNDGTLCFSTRNGGVKKLDPHRLPVSFFGRSQNAKGLQFANIKQLEPSHDGKAWVLGPVNSVGLFDPESSYFHYPLNTADNVDHTLTESISSIAEDPQGRLVLLIDEKHLVRFDPSHNRIESIGQLGPELPRRTHNALPTHIQFDSSGSLWILLREPVVYDIEKRHFRVVPSSESNPNFRMRPRCMVELSNGDFWIGTQQRGLHYYSRSEDRVTINLTAEQYPELFRYHAIYDIALDSKDRPWMGTTNGLVLFNTETREFERFMDVPELHGNLVYGLDFDKDENLWISSSNGLLYFDREKRKVRRYRQAQGFHAQTFAHNALIDLGNDRLMMGGLNGINVLDTQKISIPKQTPSPRILSASVNRASRSETRTEIPISGGQPLLVHHDDRQLRLNFAGFIYSNYHLVDYRFQIDEFSDEWNDIRGASTVELASLPPGEFNLRLKAFGVDGAPDSEEVALAIHVAPPFWRTASFISLSIAAVFFISFALVRLRTRRILRRNRTLEATVTKRTEELKKSQAEAIKANKAKSDFLACMSHEIRTPMNGVIAMNQLLLNSDLSTRQREYSTVVNQSANDLLQLINEILDFSKIEAEKLELESNPFDIRQCIENTTRLLAAKAHEKGLKVRCHCDPSMKDLVIGDSHRLKQAITNLVGNAIKFTEEGNVSLSIKQLPNSETIGRYEISVQDTGIGIPIENQKKLFDAFSQADSSTTRKFGGTGLGLAITKRIVEGMNGTITLTSEPGKGSEFSFTVEMPLSGETPERAALHGSLKGRRIVLCVEDQQETEFLQKWLAWAGAETKIERTTESLTDLLEEQKTEGQTPIHGMVIDLSKVDGRLREVIMNRKQIREFKVVGTTYLAQSVGDRKRITDACATESLNLPVEIIHKLLPTGSRPVEPDGILGHEPRAFDFHDASIRVLSVDDNRLNLRVLRELLKRYGLKVEEASSGLEAVTQAARIKYDLIFMDCLMPDLSGFEATSQIRSDREGINYDTPIIAITANAMKSDREKCIAAGMSDYLAKPIRIQDLEHVLSQWITQDLEDKRRGKPQSEVSTPSFSEK